VPRRLGFIALRYEPCELQNQALQYSRYEDKEFVLFQNAVTKLNFVCKVAKLRLQAHASKIRYTVLKIARSIFEKMTQESLQSGCYHPVSECINSASELST
jgi:hypothetical protein